MKTFLLLAALACTSGESPRQGVLPPADPLEFTLPAYVQRVRIAIAEPDSTRPIDYLYYRHAKVPVGRICNGGRRLEDGSTVHDCFIAGADPTKIYWIDLFDSRGRPITMPVGGPDRTTWRAEASIVCRHPGAKWECMPMPLRLLCPYCHKPMKSPVMHVHKDSLLGALGK